MARRNEFDMEQLRERWKELLWREEFYNASSSEQARQLGVSPMTVINWKNGMSDLFWEKYVKSFKEKLQPEFAGIMMAMIKKAKGGDVAASQFVFQRAEGWSPKSTNENINRGEAFEGKTDAEIEMELLRKADPEKLRAVLAEKKAPGVVVDLVGTGEDEYVTGETPPQAENG